MPDCDRCDRYFQYWSSYQQHISNSPNHHICDDCNKDFPSWHALRQHYIQSPRHHYCRQCDTDFANDALLRRHCLDSHHYCEECDQFFQSPLGLQEHDRQTHAPQFSCDECDRSFSSASNLREHKNSSAHRPRVVQCPGCSQRFVSKSAMIAHLESGACRSGINRHMLNELIKRIDRGHVITDPSRLLTNGESKEWIATERSWNGSAWECILCHKTCGSLGALNQHLTSPRHQDKIYLCPLSSCRKSFTSLSALCRHVESEKCGVLRFRVVRDAMDGILGRIQRLRIAGE